MQTAEHVYHLKVDGAGRVVLPAEVRTRHQITPNETIVMIDDSTGLRVRTKAEVVADAQAYFRSLVPAGISVVDELLQERRREAEREHDRP